jgi:hypothetical protein
MVGCDICGHWNTAVQREWLVTNGLGGYGCGTITGANTRRYTCNRIPTTGIAFRSTSSSTATTAAAPARPIRPDGRG